MTGDNKLMLKLASAYGLRHRLIIEVLRVGKHFHRKYFACCNASGLPNYDTRSLSNYIAIAIISPIKNPVVHLVKESELTTILQAANPIGDLEKVGFKNKPLHVSGICVDFVPNALALKSAKPGLPQQFSFQSLRNL